MSIKVLRLPLSDLNIRIEQNSKMKIQHAKNQFKFALLCNKAIYISLVRKINMNH